LQHFTSARQAARPPPLLVKAMPFMLDETQPTTAARFPEEKPVVALAFRIGRWIVSLSASKPRSIDVWRNPIKASLSSPSMDVEAFAKEQHSGIRSLPCRRMRRNCQVAA